MITFKPLTREAITEFYDRPPKRTYRGYTAVLDGKIVGIGGVYFDCGVPMAFSDLRDEMSSDKKAIARGIRILLSLYDSLGYTVYAFASPKYPTSRRLLERIGFIPTGTDSEHGELLKYKNDGRVSKDSCHL